MFTWIKTNAMMIMGYAIMALVSACALLFTFWRGADHDAQVYRDIANAQGRVIEAQNRISEREHHVDELLEHANRRVMESPNAQIIVPPDLADAWLDGIDSLRNDERSPTNGRHADVPRLGSDNAGKRRANDSRPDSDVQRSGSSVPKVQQ